MLKWTKNGKLYKNTNAHKVNKQHFYKQSTMEKNTCGRP